MKKHKWYYLLVTFESALDGDNIKLYVVCVDDQDDTDLNPDVYAPDDTMDAPGKLTVTSITALSLSLSS